MRPLPDAIVLDLRAPDTQFAGNQFLRQIVHDPVLGQIPIILGTTASDGTAAAASREVGQPDMVRVLSTPIDADAVLEVLAQVVAP
jgi:CheY-like chemotaxis protein